MSVKPNRFLQDPSQRAALYHDADGRCQSCGAELEDSWHADHIVPWSVSQRTNVFEMQALCASCNSRKGAQMQSNHTFTFDSQKLRPGQRGAIDTILSRRRSAETVTSIVLPARYGKSDVARLSALQMMADGLVSNALIVVPARNLVEQMLDEDKLRGSAQRYGFPAEVFYGVQTITAPPRLTRMRRARLSAITTSMANLHLTDLTRWVDMMLGPTGPRLPPVVYMDEAHLGSEGNRWGNITMTLVRAGAYVVVMTATPFRTDGLPIPGFESQRQVLKTAATSDGGERVIYELEPDWETTLPDAMLEDPPPLAGIAYQPFGIAGFLDDVGETAVAKVVLDDLPDAAIRRAYREALRDPAIMETAIRFFLDRVEEPQRRSEAGRYKWHRLCWQP